MLNGVYAAKASKRTPAEALAVTEVNFSVSNIAEYFIYATILLGFGVVGMSDKVWSFSQTWVWLSLVLALVGVGISHGLLKPRVKAYIETQRVVATAGAPTPEQSATLEAADERHRSRRGGARRDPRRHPADDGLQVGSLITI